MRRDGLSHEDFAIIQIDNSVIDLGYSSCAVKEGVEHFVGGMG